MWDALLDSELGLLQTVDVVILDDDGLIWRHIPGFRGYWGQLTSLRRGSGNRLLIRDAHVVVATDRTSTTTWRR